MAALLVLCAALLGSWATGHCSGTATADHLTGPIPVHDVGHRPAPGTPADIGALGTSVAETPAAVLAWATTSVVAGIPAWLSTHDLDVKLMLVLGLLTALLGAMRFRVGRPKVLGAAPDAVMTSHPHLLVTAPRLSVLCIART